MSTGFIALLANLAITLSLFVAIIFGIAQTKPAKRNWREKSPEAFLPNGKIGVGEISS